MTKRISLALSLLLFALSSLFAPKLWSEERFLVGDYNAALAERYFFSLVPYVKQRLPKQIRALDAALTRPFALFLQEIWTPQAQRAYKKWAESRGYHCAAINAAHNGLLIIASEPILSQNFTRFSQNTFFRQFGILEARIQWKGRSIRLLGAHTDSSSPAGASPTHVAQLEEIARKSHEEPDMITVLAGDLNAGDDIFFTRGEYDPAKELWFESLLLKINPRWVWTGKHLKNSTWSPSRNPLAAKPHWPLKYLGVLEKDGTWGNTDGKIDHIFVSDHFDVQEVKLLLDEPVPIKGSRPHSISGEKEVTYLSDHFGCAAYLTLKMKP